MHLVILEKTIDVIDNIDDLITVNLEENIQYNKVSEGIGIVGYIDIEGEYLNKGQHKEFKDKLSINLLAPYDEIIDKEAIVLKIQDFDYINGGNKIIFTFKLNVEGWKEVSKTFLSSDVSQENEEEIVLIESNNNKEVVAKLKELLETCKKIDKKDECISTYLENGIEEVEKIIIDNDNDERNNLIKFNITGEDLEKEELNLGTGDSKGPKCEENGYKLKEEYPLKVEEAAIEMKVEVKTPEIKKVNQDLLSSLFSKKSKTTNFCSYRVVYEGETYESIANEEKISLYELKLYNKNKTLKDGVLIKIPSKK